jgi:ZIP family zinc transporter
MNDNVLSAFLFTLLAGLSTGVGSALAFFASRTNTRFLAASLGFSAGVMIYVSFVELLNTATAELAAAFGDPSAGRTFATAAFFGGMALIAVIDKLVPDAENPHEVKSVEDMCGGDSACAVAEHSARNSRRLLRMGAMTALVIGVHNFPEGLATFVTTMKDPGLGFTIAVAIAIHNIPEGIAVSVPVFYATGDRKKAFLWSFLSGLTEPLGALAGYLVLRTFMTPAVSGMTLAAVAGIMVFISLDELLPSAEKYGEHHLSIYGAVCGMLVMALSLLLL